MSEIKFVPEKEAIMDQAAIESKLNIENARLSMETVLQKVENILWQNTKTGYPEIVDMIVSATKEEGVELTEKQIELIERKVQEWIEDILKQIEALKQLYLDGCMEEYDFNSPEFDQAWEQRQELFEQSEEPWLLAESSKLVKKGLLVRMNLKDVDPESVTIHSDHPPMIVLQFTNDEDYKKAIMNRGYSGGGSTNPAGQARSDYGYFPSITDTEKHQGLEGLKSSVAIMRGDASESTRLHEEQHLFYKKYVLPEKEGGYLYYDELAAYLKTGGYEFSDSGIFSNEKQSKFFLHKKYGHFWPKIKYAVMNLKWHGVPAEDVWAAVALAENDDDLLKRLESFDLNIDDFEPDDFQLEVAGWIGENYQNLSTEYQEKIRPKAGEYIDGFLRLWSVDTAEIFDYTEIGDETKLHLSVQYWEYCTKIIERNIDLFPELANQFIYYISSRNVPEDKQPDMDSSITFSLKKKQKEFVEKFFTDNPEELEGLNLPELSEKAEKAGDLLEKLQKWTQILKDIVINVYTTKKMVGHLMIKPEQIPDLIQELIGIDISSATYHEKADAVEQLHTLARDTNRKNNELWRKIIEKEKVLAGHNIKPHFNKRPLDSTRDNVFENNKALQEYLISIDQLIPTGND